MAILANKSALISFVASLGVGCSAAVSEEPIQAPYPVRSEAPSTPDAGPAVSEVEARLLLDEMFREAGLRILNDVPYLRADIEVTLDGYDPERGVGYEYVAPQEAGLDLSEAERLALENARGIVVIGGGTLEEVRAKAEAFLRQVVIEPTPDS